MIYLRSPGRERDFDPRSAWGDFIRNMEIGDDLYATRHVDVYANGYALRYDRVHWVDEFGMLADARYDERKWNKWWGPFVKISRQEFEDVWQAVERSPTLSLQLAGEKMSVLGAVPIWLNKHRAK
jgi:hypothetical protein